MTDEPRKDEDVPSIATRRTGTGELAPREVLRAGEDGAAETLPHGDPRRPGEGPAIQGIPGAPPAGSALGKERGPSRAEHEGEEE